MALHVQDKVPLVSEHFTADFTIILLVHVAIVFLHVNPQVSHQLEKETGERCYDTDSVE